MRDRDIGELLVDFDHYGNSAAERFSVRMSVSIGIEHPSDLIADTAQALNEA